MFLPDNVIPSAVSQEVALEGRLLLMDGHAGLETEVSRLDVAVARVDTDNHRPVLILCV